MAITGRTAKGTFAPGHHLSANLKRLTGQKVGRPKSIAGKVRDALQIAQDAMPQLIQAMISRAQGIEPDGTSVPMAVRQAATEYLCDRIYGKPNQPLTGSGGLVIHLVSMIPRPEMPTASEASNNGCMGSARRTIGN